MTSIQYECANKKFLLILNANISQFKWSKCMKKFPHILIVQDHIVENTKK